MRKSRYGVRTKPAGRARGRKITVYADAQDERAIGTLIDRLRGADDSPLPVSSIYGKALRRYIQTDHPDVWDRLYRRDDPASPAR